jgi:hypothetical protein
MEAYKANKFAFSQTDTNLYCWIHKLCFSGCCCKYLRLSKMCYSNITAISIESVQLTMPFESVLSRTEQAQGGIQLAERKNERGSHVHHCCCALCPHLRVFQSGARGLWPQWTRWNDQGPRHIQQKVRITLRIHSTTQWFVRRIRKIAKGDH